MIDIYIYIYKPIFSFLDNDIINIMKILNQVQIKLWLFEPWRELNPN